MASRGSTLTTSYCQCEYMGVKDERLQVRVDPTAKRALSPAYAIFVIGG